jgi:hypothetical protein
MAFYLLKMLFDFLILVFSASKMTFYLLKMLFDFLILVFSASKITFYLLILVFSASKMTFYLLKMLFDFLISVVHVFDDNSRCVAKAIADLPEFSQADQYGTSLR